MTDTNSQSAYLQHVANLEKNLRRDEALQQAVGGEFLSVGKLEYALLRQQGLRDNHLVVDVGCGSGRLAVHLAPFMGIRYSGTDVVPELLQYASDLCHRDDWKFSLSNGQSIPCDGGIADFVCFFSVFTHLLHEDSFRYLQEASRVLRSGGIVILSFLEFRIPCHWDTFKASLLRTESGRHLNQFIDRDALNVWARETNFKIVGIFDGDKPHIPISEEIIWEAGQRMVGMGNLGQSVAVMRKT